VAELRAGLEKKKRVIATIMARVPGREGELMSAQTELGDLRRENAEMEAFLASQGYTRAEDGTWGAVRDGVEWVTTTALDKLQAQLAAAHERIALHEAERVALGREIRVLRNEQQGQIKREIEEPRDEAQDTRAESSSELCDAFLTSEGYVKGEDAVWRKVMPINSPGRTTRWEWEMPDFVKVLRDAEKGNHNQELEQLCGAAADAIEELQRRLAVSNALNAAMKDDLATINARNHELLAQIDAMRPVVVAAEAHGEKPDDTALCDALWAALRAYREQKR
jgi:hypothetical protein